MRKSISIGRYLLLALMPQMIAVLSIFNSILPARGFIDHWAISWPQTYKFNISWSISNYSNIDFNEVLSPRFEPPGLPGHSFWLHLYPMGFNPDQSSFVSLYLNWESSIQNSLNVKFTFWLLNNKREAIVKSVDKQTFTKETSWGFPMFVDRSFLNNENNNLLINDKLRILAEISFSQIKNKTTSFDEIVPMTKPDSSIGKYFISKKYSDVTLVVNDQIYPAHKIILASQSQIFDAMFEKMKNHQTTSSIHINSFNSSAVKELLRFLYEGRVENLNDLSEEIIVLANNLKINDLKKLAEDALSKKVNSGNAVKMLQLANKYKSRVLKSKAIKYILSTDTSTNINILNTNSEDLKTPFMLHYKM